MGSDCCAQCAEYVADLREDTEIEQPGIDYAKLFVGPSWLLALPMGLLISRVEKSIVGRSTLVAHHRHREVLIASSWSWSSCTSRSRVNFGD